MSFTSDMSDAVAVFFIYQARLTDFLYHTAAAVVVVVVVLVVV